MIAPLVYHQTQLFDQGEHRTKQHLASLIDTLSSRLGRDGVLEAKVERDSEPDQAVSYRPLTGRRADGRPQETSRKLNSRLASHSAEPRPTDPLRRPVHLLTPPEMLMAVAMDDDQRLVEFVHSERRGQVVSHWGPERLESGWWRGPSMRRDYYRIETSDGAWWWIYRDLATGQWYLHGMFG
jgi:protein ImuB